MFKEHIESQYYVNLYKFASNLLDELIIKCKKATIVTNSYSLIAGLTFDLLRKKIKNYCVIDLNLNNLKKIKEFDFVFIVSNNSKLNEVELKYNYFFEYTGHESNILCIE